MSSVLGATDSRVARAMREEAAGIRANAAKDKDRGRAATWLGFAKQIEAWAAQVERLERGAAREVRLVQYRARSIDAAAAIVGNDGNGRTAHVRQIAQVADQIAHAVLATETPAPAPAQSTAAAVPNDVPTGST